MPEKPLDTPDAQLISQRGIDLAHEAHWNGIYILKVASAALTDANFHDEAMVLDQMIVALETREGSLRGYELTIQEEE